MKPQAYVEVDLPPVISLKKELLGETVPYRMIPGSVLETGWMEEVRAMQVEKVLFLAEGLLMYLPEKEVVRLFNRLTAKNLTITAGDSTPIPIPTPILKPTPI